jgi:hypothetical protein
VGTRIIRKNRSAAAQRREELIVLGSVIGAVGVPFALACFLVAADIRSDLSDLRPARALADPATALVGWPELETRDGRPTGIAVPHARMLGYMMDRYQPAKEGERVEMFMLLPEAGQIMHPAHREPAQMIEIRLVRAAPFRYRRLTWVTGKLTPVKRRSDSEQAFYSMREATAEPAAQRDITHWFMP